MRDAVLAAYNTFTQKFEGYLPYMYLDVKGLVTTGIGNLIDPIGTALELPWRNPDGGLASAAEVTRDWNNVKSHQELKDKGGVIFKQFSTVRLDKAGIEQVVRNKLFANEVILKQRFRAFDSWPADAQLGTHSMAWAAGANFKSPKFDAAVNSNYPDFKTASVESHLNEAGNPGLKPRNEANAELFLAAADALKSGDLNTLHWQDIMPSADTIYEIRNLADKALSGNLDQAETYFEIDDIAAKTAKTGVKLAITNASNGVKASALGLGAFGAYKLYKYIMK